MLKLVIQRKQSSYNFRADPAAPDSFANNWQNNRQDRLFLCDYANGKTLFMCNVQTVANYCFGDFATADTVKHGDTIAPCTFGVKCFVEPRNFHGEIHGIVNAIDIDGQVINCNSMQTTKDGYQNGRFLIHDMYSFKTGRDTNYAWSAGCFIMTSKDLQGFNSALKQAGVKAGDIIDGALEET